MEILGKAEAGCHDKCHKDLRKVGANLGRNLRNFQFARCVDRAGSDASPCKQVSDDWPDFGIGPSGALRCRGQ
jgi:hypothetical protein